MVVHDLDDLGGNPILGTPPSLSLSVCVCVYIYIYILGRLSRTFLASLFRPRFRVYIGYIITLTLGKVYRNFGESIPQLWGKYTLTLGKVYRNFGGSIP